MSFKYERLQTKLGCRGCKYCCTEALGIGPCCSYPGGIDAAADGRCYYRVETDISQIAQHAVASMQRGASLDDATQYVQYHLGRLYEQDPPSVTYRAAWTMCMAALQQ